MATSRAATGRIFLGVLLGAIAVGGAWGLAHHRSRVVLRQSATRLDEARQHVDAGRLAAAESLLYQVGIDLSGVRRWHSLPSIGRGAAEVQSQAREVRASLDRRAASSRLTIKRVISLVVSGHVPEALVAIRRVQRGEGKNDAVLAALEPCIVRLSVQDFAGAQARLRAFSEALRPDDRDLADGIAAAITGEQSANRTQQRSIAGQVKEVVDADSPAPQPPVLVGRAMVWDYTRDGIEPAYELLPDDLRASSRDGPITMFCIRKRTNERIGTYSISGQPAYQEHMEVGVVYWPALRAGGIHTVLGGEPPMVRPVSYHPEYGSSVKIKEWIEQLRRSESLPPETAPPRPPPAPPAVARNRDVIPFQQPAKPDLQPDAQKIKPTSRPANPVRIFAEIAGVGGTTASMSQSMFDALVERANYDAAQVHFVERADLADVLLTFACLYEEEGRLVHYRWRAAFWDKRKGMLLLAPESQGKLNPAETARMAPDLARMRAALERAEAAPPDGLPRMYASYEVDTLGVDFRRRDDGSWEVLPRPANPYRSLFYVTTANRLARRVHIDSGNSRDREAEFRYSPDDFTRRLCEVLDRAGMRIVNHPDDADVVITTRWSHRDGGTYTFGGRGSIITCELSVRSARSNETTWKENITAKTSTSISVYASKFEAALSDWRQEFETKRCGETLLAAVAAALEGRRLPAGPAAPTPTPAAPDAPRPEPGLPRSVLPPAPPPNGNPAPGRRLPPNAMPRRAAPAPPKDDAGTAAPAAEARAAEQKLLTEREVASECHRMLELADNYIANGKPDSARKQLRKIIDTHPQSTWADVARKRLSALAEGGNEH